MTAGRPSLLAGIAEVRQVLRQRRLRLHDLPPVPRWLSRVGLGLAVLGAGLLALFPLFEAGDGPIRLAQGPDGARISILGFVLAMSCITGAMGLATYAAPASARRLVVAAAGLGGLIILPTDAYGFAGLWATWAMFVGLTAVAALWVTAAAGRPRARATVATLAVVPPLAATAIVLVASGVPAVVGSSGPIDIGALVGKEAMEGVAAFRGLLVALAMWAMIEYAHGLGAASGAALRLPSTWWSALFVLLGLKLVWLAGGALDILPPLIGPMFSVGDAVSGESWASFLLAAALAVVVGLAITRNWGARSDPGAALGGLWFFIVPLIGAFVLPALLLQLASAINRFGVRLGLLADRTFVDASLSVIGPFADVLRTTAPLLAALATLAAGWFLRGRHASAPYMLGIGAWVLLPSLSFTLLEMGVPLWDQPATPDLPPSVFGHANPLTNDLAITALVAVTAFLARRGSIGRVAPGLLIGLLVASTVAAYGDRLVPAEWASFLAWVGLAFPVLAQYGLDGDPLNRPAPDRSARVLFAIGGTLMAIGASYAAIAAQQFVPGEVETSDVVRQLVLLPLAVMLVVVAGASRPRAGELAS